VQVNVIARHVEVSDHTKHFIEEKASRLPRYYDRVSAIEVILDQEGDLSSVEMIVRAAGSPDFVGKEVGPETKACVDLLIDKMERQLTRHKEKFRNRKHLAKKPELHDES